MASGRSTAEAAFYGQLQADAEFWGRTYQTADDPQRIQAFIDDVVAYRNAARAAAIRKTIDAARPAFAGESGTNPDTLCRILFYIALHESEGGRYDRQTGGGGGRGWWQVNPKSARTILDSSSTLWSPKARLATGYSLATLKTKTDGELANLLMEPAFCCTMAAYLTLARAESTGQIAYLRT